MLSEINGGYFPAGMFSHELLISGAAVVLCEETVLKFSLASVLMSVCDNHRKNIEWHVPIILQLSL